MNCDGKGAKFAIFGIYSQESHQCYHNNQIKQFNKKWQNLIFNQILKWVKSDLNREKSTIIEKMDFYKDPEISFKNPEVST